MMTAAAAAATSFSRAIGMPERISGSPTTGSSSPVGNPAKTSVALPRIIAPRPIVTMISEIAGRVRRRCTTIALKAMPRAAMASAANTIPPAKSSPGPSPSESSPSECWASPASKAPSIIPSPSAKLIIRDDL
jgi:hypothetical protein